MPGQAASLPREQGMRLETDRVVLPSERASQLAAGTLVGAALCRERAAQQPQGFSADAQIAGAAVQPFRDTRPLLHGFASAWSGRSDGR